MPTPVTTITAALERFATRHLALLLGAIFVADVMIPDMLPFIDEIVLGIATLLVARWQSRRRADEERPPPKDVTPPRS